MEELLGGLQRHALVDEGAAADAGRADRGHILADGGLEQAGVAGEVDGAAEDLGGGAEPQGALVGLEGVGEGASVRAGGPPASPFDDDDGHSCLREAES